MRRSRRTFLTSTVGFLPILGGCIGAGDQTNENDSEDDFPDEEESNDERSDDHWLDRADLGFAVGQDDCDARSPDVTVEDVTVSTGGSTALKMQITEVTHIRVFDSVAMESSGHSTPNYIDISGWEFNPEPDTTRDTFPIENIWGECTDVTLSGLIQTHEDIEVGQHTFIVILAGPDESERRSAKLLVKIED